MIDSTEIFHPQGVHTYSKTDEFDLGKGCIKPYDSTHDESHIVDKIIDNSYNPLNTKEDVTMSSIIFYNDSNGTIIASDSRNTHIKTDEKGNVTQYNYNDEKQKLFKFSNGVIGVCGTTSFYDEPISNNTNPLRKEIEDFITPLLKYELYAEDIEAFCIKMQPLVIQNNETTLICVFQNGKSNIVKSFTFSARDITIKNFSIIPNFISFAVFFINKPTEILYKELKEKQEKKVKEIINLYIDMEKYNNNYPRIGGPIQMYKIPLEGEIKNLSESPFDKN